MVGVARLLEGTVMVEVTLEGTVMVEAMSLGDLLEGKVATTQRTSSVLPGSELGECPLTVWYIH